MVRYKNRYVLFEVEGIDNAGNVLNSNDIFIAISKKVEELYGDFGSAAIQSGFSVRYCNDSTRIVIVRVRLGPHRLLASVLPLITSVKQKPVALKTLYIGASLQQCYKHVQKHQQNLLDEVSSALKNEDLFKREVIPEIPTN